MSTTKLYPSAHLGPALVIEVRLEKIRSIINSISTSLAKLTELIFLFEDENRISRKNYKKKKSLSKIRKSFDTFFKYC